MAKRSLGHRPPTIPQGLPRPAGPTNNCLTCGMKADFGRKIAAAKSLGQLPDEPYSGYLFGIAEASIPPNVEAVQPRMKWVLNCMMAQGDKLVGSMSIPIIALPEILGQMFRTIENVGPANEAFEWAAQTMESSGEAPDVAPPDAIDVTPLIEDAPGDAIDEANEVVEKVIQFRGRNQAEPSDG